MTTGNGELAAVMTTDDLPAGFVTQRAKGYEPTSAPTPTPATATTAATTAAPATGEVTASMARLIRASVADIQPRADEFAQYFYGALFSLAPETMDLFPMVLRTQRGRFVRALLHVVELVDRQREVTAFLAQLGRDHRKFGVLGKHYEPFGRALLDAVRRFAGDGWTADVETAWTNAYEMIAGTMRKAAADDESPAWWPAEVLTHQRIGPDLAIVTVRPDHPVPYLAGQYIAVETPQRRRLWRYLSPANAPRSDGVLEFAVRAVPGGWASRAIVGQTRPGDRWKLGAPLGRLIARPDDKRNLLMIAGGTGISPMRAIIEGLAGDAAGSSGESVGGSVAGDRRSVQLFYGGRTADDLYALPRLRELAQRHRWLSVVPVLEAD
ncbi:MAG: hypothetical protein J2O49_00870, partial [Sciscionella sp.]|nr:hypothetical protein [Sciscionella sp.]